MKKGSLGGSASIEVEASSQTLRGRDRRRHDRYVVEGDAEIVVRNGSSLFRGRILNISESGCYIQSLAYVHLSPATAVDILFVVGGKIVTVKAESRTSTPRVGVGFQFMAINRETAAILQTILASLRLHPSNSAPSRRHGGTEG